MNIHPDVVKAYKKTQDAEHAHGEYGTVITKRTVTRTANTLSKKIKQHHPDLDMKGKIKLRTNLQNMHSEENNPRIPRKKGQPANSDKHSDLYTDENPKGTIHGLKFATVKDAKASVKKIENSGKKHAHKIQAAVAMEQRAKVMGKVGPAAVYRKYIEAMKKKTKKMNEAIKPSHNMKAMRKSLDKVLKPIKKKEVDEDVPTTSTADVAGAGDDGIVVVDRRRRKDKEPVVLKRFRGFMKHPSAPRPEEFYRKK